jgi:restriction system protein
VARRRKTSPAEDLIDLIALLPWWAGVVLAVVSYAVLHRLAAQQIATAVHPGQVSALMTQSIWKGLATVGQYVLPLICLAGAGTRRGSAVTDRHWLPTWSSARAPARWMA